MNTWVQISQIIYNALLGTAVLVGGAWALYITIIQRSFQAALKINILVDCIPTESGYSVIKIDILLENTGHRVLYAVYKRPAGSGAKLIKPIFEDGSEVLYHSCGLSLRRINMAPQGSTVLAWFNSPYLLKVEGLEEEINLLHEYESEEDRSLSSASFRNQKPWFLLEPGETCRLAIALLLPPGHYLGRVVFVGSRPPNEYWSHIFYIHVSNSNSILLRQKI